MNTKQIYVGGYLVNVPSGYIKLEREYTEYELANFDNAVAKGDERQIEKCRKIVLQKRVEFYEHYIAGKVIIPEIEDDKKKSFWQNFTLSSIFS